jgi:thiosulfate/3-mercaptopyruvate sulfurtransferase
MNEKMIQIATSALVCMLMAAGCQPAVLPPASIPTAAAVPTGESPTPVPTAVPTLKPVAIDRTEYVHPEILVDAPWVAKHLNDTNMRILDTRNPLEAALYPTGHIPGAVFVDVFSDLCCPSEIMGIEPFSQLMGKLGIGDDTSVVLYDIDGGIWSARVWWALNYYGHQDVKILNGGLMAWIQTGQPLDTQIPSVAPAVFHAQVQPQWKASMEDVTKAIQDPDVYLVDALDRPSYFGDLIQYPRPGHIPTALSFPAVDAIDPVTKTVLAPQDLSRMLTRLGIDPQKRVITYCGGGYAGAYDAFVLYLMGFDHVGLYDGSRAQWTSYSANPMEVGPE